MHKKIALLMVLSAIALMTMVPGGPVETRDFSHISPWILGIFNLFLTTLGLGSLMFAYFVRLEYRWAVGGAGFAALGYLLVYLLDLARVFPQSPTPMPALLEAIEVVGVLLALPALYYCIGVLVQASEGTVVNSQFRLPTHWLPLMLVIAIVGLIIIVFATLAAMGRLPV